MSRVLLSVEELIQKTPDRNNQQAFSEMWQILCELKQKIAQRFELTLDPSVQDLDRYGSADGKTQGHLSAYAGNEIHWIIHSYKGTPAHSFTNMHLTVWLGPQVRVPHFGMALGTIPDMFFYLDYVPRADLMTDLEYLDRYYEPQNARALAFDADPEWQAFVSRSLYMRVAQSRTSLCYMASPSTAHIEKVRQTAHQMLDQWIQHVNEAEKVPVEQQAELAARDLLIRRSISQRDPANVMGEKIFGEELTQRLVGTLWGQGRQTQRAGSWQQ